MLGLCLPAQGLSPLPRLLAHPGHAGRLGGLLREGSHYPSPLLLGCRVKDARLEGEHAGDRDI